MEYDVLKIAKWLIKYNNFKNATEGEDLITNLKLQKLLYYAQSMSLGFNNKKIFSDRFEPWQHGPVLKNVYDEYKCYGSKGIEYSEEDIKLDDDTEEILKTTYEYFGKYSAWGLRKLTHTEKPWINAYRKSNLPENYAKVIYIDENEMKEQFIEKYVK